MPAHTARRLPAGRQKHLLRLRQQPLLRTSLQCTLKRPMLKLDDDNDDGRGNTGAAGVVVTRVSEIFASWLCRLIGAQANDQSSTPCYVCSDLETASGQDFVGQFWSESRRSVML